MSIWWFILPSALLWLSGWGLCRLGRWMQNKAASQAVRTAPSEPETDEEPVPAPANGWKPPAGILEGATHGVVLPFPTGGRRS